MSFVVVQFAPGGPVERVIAQLSGCRYRRRPRASPARRAATSARAAAQGGSQVDAVNSKYRGAQGLDPEFIKQPGEAVRLRQAGLRALLR